jgi:hypothetical protein
MTFLNRHRSRIRPVGPFSPSSLFFGGIPGAWYDPTDLATMFQDSTGTTPVTAVEQPVGLILDKSQGLALGAELVTNGTFPVNLNGWTIGDGTPTWVAPGAMRLDSTSARQSAYQDVPTVIGATYEIRATLSNFSAGGFAPRLSVWSGAFVSLLGSIGLSAGTFVGRFRATATTIRLQAYADLGGIANFDDISVRELAGNHASQSTAASRPTYRARYNLLTYSEQFNNVAGWNAARGTATGDTTVAPDGTMTADTWTEDNQVGDHDLRQVIAITTGVTYTISCYFKANTRTFAQISTFGTGIGLRGAVVNLSNGSVANMGGGYGAFASVSATALANGWYRLQVTQTAGATGNTTLSVGATTTSTGTPSYAGDGVSNLYIWGAQLLTAADVTATGNAYQRIAAATVYDTAPIFRPYLAFDGMDDSLATSAINFTATDKMTVFAGVTKSSDASASMIAELSTGVAAGSFAVGTAIGPAASYFSTLTGTSTAYYTETTFAAPITNVLTTSYDIAGAAIASEIFPRVNAATPALAATGASAGTGTFGTWPLYIGRRAGTSLPFNGRLYELVVRGAASSVTEIADTELWVNARTGGY